MIRASLTFGALLAAAVAVGLSGSLAIAQSPPGDNQPETGPSQSAPMDVPPEFLKPQGSPNAPASAPSPNAAPEGAQQQPQNGAEGGGMSGAWEFSNADHDRICHFNFRADDVAGGHRVDIDKNCPDLFPSTKTIVAWAADNYGNLKLLDASGNAVIELTEVEGGMYDGFSPEEGRYILQTAAAVPTRSADDMIGDWAVSRANGKPICTLTLADSPAGDNLALKIKPGCDAFVTRFGPVAWQMDEGALVLFSSRGQTWQFEEGDVNNTWQRVPDSADHVMLTRQ